ncbi:hypothetical protein GOBAR_AA15766 [Gossypium barbadense]|uniref:Uncharacterized protein n=1 Tax=Gossypium barbadense TaxID=3634 RepID=A0A2P5XNL5_GOSBA|nr:hypothetical protein GOBAR_AA15766 [Gossypium barbadense]
MEYTNRTKRSNIQASPRPPVVVRTGTSRTSIAVKTGQVMAEECFLLVFSWELFTEAVRGHWEAEVTIWTKVRSETDLVNLNYRHFPKRTDQLIRAQRSFECWRSRREANGDTNGAIGSGNGNDAGAAAAEAGRAATAAALQEAAGAGKLVDTNAPVDEGTESNMLHDFELPISLDVLRKFGGHEGAVAGFMARKQRIEATVGCRVPENDGRRHALTLTVSDYKRRRGLL